MCLSGWLGWIGQSLLTGAGRSSTCFPWRESLARRDNTLAARPLAAVLVVCSSIATSGLPQASAQTTKVTGDPGDPESSKALCVREIGEGWNGGNAGVALEIVAPSFVFHSFYPEVTDFEYYRRWIEGHIDPENPTQITTRVLIAEGDKVLDLSIAHLGEGLEEPGIRITRFADGKMVEMWRTLDALPVPIELGLFSTFPELSGG